VTEDPSTTNPEQAEIARLRRDAEARDAEISRLQVQAADAAVVASRQNRLIQRLRGEADLHDGVLAAVHDQLQAAQHELVDLRAVRDALTPPDLPARPGLGFAVSFSPASHRVSGDFYLAAEGPGDGTVLVVGDVAGKGEEAARRAAFVRTTFAATAQFSDDPCQLLEWANIAMTERAGFSSRFVTAACITFDVTERRMRWALAGHPPPLRLGDGAELLGGMPGPPLGVIDHLGCVGSEAELHAGEGVLLYTDGLVEARADGELYGTARATAIVREMASETPEALVERLRSEAAAFGGGDLADDLCLLAAYAT
jgi:phosphoserine phosphatase RsbU/P